MAGDKVAQQAKLGLSRRLATPHEPDLPGYVATLERGNGHFLLGTTPAFTAISGSSVTPIPLATICTTVLRLVAW